MLEMLVTYNFKEMISCGFWVEYQKHLVSPIEAAIDSYLPQSEHTNFSYQCSNISSHGYLISGVLASIHSRIFLRPILLITSIQFHRTQFLFVKLLAILPGYHEMIFDLIVKFLREPPISAIDMWPRIFQEISAGNCVRNLFRDRRCEFSVLPGLGFIQGSNSDVFIILYPWSSFLHSNI